MQSIVLSFSSYFYFMCVNVTIENVLNAMLLAPSSGIVLFMAIIKHNINLELFTYLIIDVDPCSNANSMFDGPC